MTSRARSKPLCEQFFSDYKQFAGIPRATRIRFELDGQVQMQTEITEYQVYDKLDDRIFAKP